VKNSVPVMEVIGAVTPKQQDKVACMSVLNKSQRTEALSLLTIIEAKKRTLCSLLRYFVSGERLERAEKVKDDEVRITCATDSYGSGSRHHIIIDYNTKRPFFTVALAGRKFQLQRNCAKTLLSCCC